MSWGKIKTILIILFLFTDIFLAVAISTAKKKEAEVSPEVIDAAVQILKQHNISIDKSVIPTKSPSVPALEADNVVSDYESFAGLVLGTDFSSDGENSFKSGNKKLTFSGDKFLFKAENNPEKIDAYTLKEAQKFAFSYLKSLGFDMSDAKIINSKKTDNAYNLKIRDFFEKMPIFSSEIDISVSKSGILELSGSWFNKRDVSTPQNTVKSTAAVLSDFAASRTEHAPIEIIKTELGYSIFDSETYHKSASFIPVNKITLKSGYEYYLDSRAEQ